MTHYQTVEFDRLDGSGETTVEYLEVATRPATLAYLDTYRDGTAAAVVFDPHTGRSRTYARRDGAKATGIIDRHLAKLGYTEEED